MTLENDVAKSGKNVRAGGDKGGSPSRSEALGLHQSEMERMSFVHYLREMGILYTAALLLNSGLAPESWRDRLAEARRTRINIRLRLLIERARRRAFDAKLVSAQSTEPPSAYDVVETIKRSAKPNNEHFVGYTKNPPIGNPVARVIAFYLPQYHTIPENDAWWGRGFTEWTNVTKATPRYLGHLQPRFPGELGYYDLGDSRVLPRQIELAKNYGVAGFCFHYYWFAGKRLLEKPIDLFRSRERDPSFDFPFCLNWANENWTRTWDGEQHHVLMAQNHTKDDHRGVIRDLLRYMADRRYIRIDGAPLILVYRPPIIHGLQQMLEIWREEAVRAGHPGLFIAACNARDYSGHIQDGFDALVEFPPHGALSKQIIDLGFFSTDFRGAVYSFEDEVEMKLRQYDTVDLSANRIIPGVMPAWDNEARRPNNSSIFHGAHPRLFERWMRGAISTAARTPSHERRIVFINAWNEWAESAVLEPDRHFGYANLQAVYNSLEGLSRAESG